MNKNKVELYVYDLTHGTASNLSPMLLGRKIDGIWHTGIVVYGREYYFGSRGIESCNPSTTILGEPVEKIHLGDTQIPYTIFSDFLAGLGQSTFASTTYNLLTHNCNHFSNELSQFLCGVSISNDILNQSDSILNGPWKGLIEGLIKRLQSTDRVEQIDDQSRILAHASSPGYDDLNEQIEEARYNSFLLDQKRKTLKEKLLKKERKRDKRRKKLRDNVGVLPIELNFNMADTAEINGGDVVAPPVPPTLVPADEDEAAEREAEEERKRARDPPIVFKDVLDAKTEFDALLALIDGKLNDPEKKSMEELQVYMLGNEGSWALGDDFLTFIGRLLNDKTLPDAVRVHTINILAVAALKDDVILFLHQDRRDHVLMNYAYEIDRLSLDEQLAIAIFIANMFENLGSSEWLMYISEWTYNNQQSSNIRVTTKVAVHSLLADELALQERGTAIVYNLACKEVKTVVFDDIAVELTMAILQFLNGKPSEELLYRCVKSLAKFAEVSKQEVPQLIQMIGPDPKSFKGISERVDEFVDKISAQLR